MDTKYQLMKIDYWIQKILGIAILICCFSVFGIVFGIMGLIPFGAAQVLSGLVFAIVYKDRKRWIYLLIVAIFFLCWYGATEVSYDSKFYEVAKLSYALLFFTPPALGIWYFSLTSDQYNDLKRLQKSHTINDEQVLDA
jgi:hypothetical protein